MKNLLTFAGWILVGVIVAFTGRQLWQNWKGNNPEKAEVIEKHVKETVVKNKAKVKEVANKAMDLAANKLHEQITKSTSKPEPVQPVPEPKAKEEEKTVVKNKAKPEPKTLEEIEAETIGRLAAVEQDDVAEPEKLGTPRPIPPVTTRPIPPVTKGRETVASERLARIADDNDDDEPVEKVKRVPLTVISEREKRLQRQEEVLLQRQMRIIDDLME